MSTPACASTGVTTRAGRKAATRQRLLDAAVEVFSAGSVVTTPVEAVADAAGVSKATLFFHFGSRLDLLDAVATRLYWHDDRWQATGAGLVTFLRRCLAAQRHPGARLLWEIGDLMSAEGRPSPDLAYLHLQQILHGHLVEEGIDEGRARHLTGVLAPATLMVARRAAFGQADDAELRRFVRDVTDLVEHSRLRTGSR